MGLAYDKLTYLGLKHIERGYIPGDEYEDFMKYLYEPYIELGGNGMASRVMDEVAKLPLRKGPPIQTPPTVTEKQIADGDEYNGEPSW